MNAAIYVRASTELQKYSTTNQLMTLNQYALEHGLTVATVYEDNGKSGLTLQRRPALRRLLKDVLDVPRPFDVVLVYDVSRWGRFQDADESAFYEHLCKRNGARVVYAEEPFNNDNSAVANVMKAMKRAMAAEFSRDLSRKVQVSQIHMVGRGFWQGGIPGYGLRRVLLSSDGTPRGTMGPGQRKGFHNDRVIIRAGSPQEIATVRRIFRMFAVKGMRLTEIARQLNVEKIPPPRGTTWFAGTISLMLRNERYIGTYAYNKTTMPLGAPRKQNPRSEWVSNCGAIEATVSVSLFKKAQTRFAQYRSLHRRKSNEELLTELKALLDKKGSLSNRIIKAERSMATPETYAQRFGSLPKAYRLVGYDCPDYTTISALNAQSAYSREELLDRLRVLLKREGRITCALIAAAPDVPAHSTYTRTFKSLHAAYAELGLAPIPSGTPPRNAAGQRPTNPLLRQSTDAALLFPD